MERNVIKAEALEDYRIMVTFGDGVRKKVDLTRYINTAAFSVLKDKNNISKFICRGYFIEWPEHDLDMSADTLWHEGELVQ